MRTSMKQVQEYARLCCDAGLDIRIPWPADRPLVILHHQAFENPNPRVMRFKTLAGAKDFLEALWQDTH